MGSEGIPLLSHDQIDIPFQMSTGDSLPITYWEFDDKGIPAEHKAAMNAWRTLLSACGLEGVCDTTEAAMEVVAAQERAIDVYSGKLDG